MPPVETIDQKSQIPEVRQDSTSLAASSASPRRSVWQRIKDRSNKTPRAADGISIRSSGSASQLAVPLSDKLGASGKIQRVPPGPQEPAPATQILKSNIDPGVTIQPRETKPRTISDLWNEAYEDLKAKDPPLINEYEEILSGNLPAMIACTASIPGISFVDRQRQMAQVVQQFVAKNENDAWKVPLGDGKRVRELVEPVVGVVDWAKDFVGSALEASRPGSLAWAGVCLLLPLLLNPSKERKSNLDGLEEVAGIVSRCNLREKIYQERYESDIVGNGKPQTDHDLDEYLSTTKELYLRILAFEAQSIRHFHRMSLVRGVRLALALDGWSELLAAIRSQEEEVNRSRSLLDAAKYDQDLRNQNEAHQKRTLVILDKMDELKVEVVEVKAELRGFRDDGTEREYAKYMEVLRTSDYSAAKNRNPEPTPNTCQSIKWFLNSPKHLAWISPQPTSRLLWVSADPGCGKSVLARDLVDYHIAGPTYYFFFKNDTETAKSVSHALCALLHQICKVRTDLFHLVLPTLRQNGGKLADLSLFDELWKVFRTVIQDPLAGSMTLVLDALDECDDPPRGEFLRRLALVSCATYTAKILITSRPYTSIRTALVRSTKLDLEQVHLSGDDDFGKKLIEKEISLFITTKVEEFRKSRVSEDIQDNAHEILLKHLSIFENKTYLWVSAIFSKVEADAGEPLYRLKETIRTLPRDVDKAYESILNQKRDAKDIDLLKKLLQIVLVAKRPLSIMEFQIASRCPKKISDLEELQPAKSFRTWIRNFCGFFIRIVDDAIFLVHQTAREYLLESNDFPNSSGWKHSLKLKDAHKTLARICIEYLLIFDSSLPEYQDVVLLSRQDITADGLLGQENIQISESSLLLLGFLDREGMENWLNNDQDQGRERVGIDFASQGGVMLFKYAAEYWHTHYENGSQDSDLYLACKILCRSTSSIWRTWYILHVIRSYESELAAAFASLGDDLSFHAINGNITALSHILESVDYRDYSEDERTFALLNSIGRGQADAVSKLLQAGVDPDSTAPLHNRFGDLSRSALHIAAGLTEERADGAKIVQILLDAGANPNILDKYTNGSRETPSFVAARVGNIDALKALVSAGADPNILDTQMRSWLYHIAIAERAVNLGHKQRYSYQKTLNLVGVCKDAGVDIHNVDILGYTALHFAVLWRAPGTLEGLLEAGCDYKIQDSKGRTALGIASSKLESLKLLSATDHNRHAIELYRKMLEIFEAREVAGRPT